MSKSLTLWGCLLCLALAVPALAGEDAAWVESDQGPAYDHRQLAVSVGLRIDETQSVDAQPEISVKYLGWFTRYIAVTSELGFTNRTSFSWNSEARTLSFGVGLRLSEPGEFGAMFIEPGLLLQRHSGDLDGTDFTATRMGIKLAIGGSVNVTKRSSLDLSVRLLLNNAESRPDYVYSPNLPEPPPDQIRYFGGADEYDLFNTTYVLLAYRFGL